ncbi:hypothetical protein [Methylobrevis pamukkalensis]|uniref:Uncharacterized protein n=1 Tax=Methylobrevis pamukkalensis TaxID=1439726 RepID=A0A1E3GXR9_9HYPH|nr:hypothetical protein [Methylobrevis pamukkalensis]ODN68850.1 hypothetical protein A6302_03855 [Methylobrevis pamukkalensis]
MRDLYSNVGIRAVIAPVVVGDNTATVGTVIDRAGFESVTYLIATGTLADADATFAVLLEESDASGSGFAAVDDVHLLGTEADAGFTFADDGEVRKLGYRGLKRYTRLTITPTGNSGSAPIAALAVLGHPADAPVS